MTLGVGTACSSPTPAPDPAPDQIVREQTSSPASTRGPGATADPAPRPSREATDSGRPADVTQQAAGRYVPLPGTAAPSGTTDPAEVAPQVDDADPLVVAQNYVASRLTYRFDDPAGYTAALTSAAFTTPGFAARSTPSASALARLTTSQETRAVQVAGAELANEAPNSASTRYVVVTCTATTTYRGGDDTTAAAWTLRLLQVAPAQWRVDGVLSTD